MSTAPENQSPPLIEMRDVAVGALRDMAAPVAEQVNWTVAPGEFWAIGGLQGAGKSDFLMMTAGLMPPRAGEYRLFGETMPIFDESRLAQRLRLGLVFDGGQLLNHLTLFENVALPLRYQRNLSRAEVEDEVGAMLSAMELLPWASSTPGAMPRPWRKRAGLARALMLRPELLLVDCPISSADLRHANWWLGFLDTLAHGHALLGGRPVTLIATTEDLRPWRGHATQFACLANRRFTVLGDWAQVEQNPGSAVRVLLGKTNPAERPPFA